MRHRENRSGIYLLPNLFTTASLFAAFYAIVATMHSHFETAVIAIFIGMIADGLDGRIARMTNTQTAFGAEYDSLTDMVTFGVTPALLFYNWSLNELGKIGWLIAFVYTAAVALRLARFNTQLETADKRYFQGLSSTLGAALMASFAWFCNQHEWNQPMVSGLLTLSTAILMVSNIRYNSFKEVDFKGKIPFLYVLLIVFLFVAIAINPSFMLFIASLFYAASGPFQTLRALHRVRQHRRRVAARRKQK